MRHAALRLSVEDYGGLPASRHSVTCMEIKAGDHVIAVNARGERSERIALSEVVMGRDFPVIWICRPDEWITAQAEGRQPESVPWPAEDVHPQQDACC
jgi:hypothetical protein